MRILVDSSTLIALAKINELEVITYDGDASELRKYGLGLGEASLLLVARREDKLVLDDANARRFAESDGVTFTGLIGLLVAAVKTKRLKIQGFLRHRLTQINTDLKR
ncbi:MAG: hypothetical protein KAT65_21610 [Methanophagales archaeon]|nr:hypothetical protein [Methanophagales archaeon]